MRTGLWVLAFGALVGCSGSSVSEEERAEATDSARAVVGRVVASVNKKDLAAVFAMYAPDSNAWHAEDGSRHASLAALQGANRDFMKKVETVSVSARSIDVQVLTPDVAVVTAPMRLSFKPNGRDLYRTTGIWSGVVQRRDGKWLIVQSHESHANPAGMNQALASARAAAKAPATKTSPARTTARKR